MGRRLSRELALKILYRYEEGDRELSKVLDSVLEAKQYAEEDKKFSRELVEMTIDNLKTIDEQIINVLENWPFDRVSVIDKIILRLGTCEILYFKDIPPQVSINEAIEIAKKYGGGDSGKFVNGVLDAVKKNYESSDNQ
ncbi:MAG TPA: transcription antitermination factor NusB [candidate division WOR-3 bacterium]|uniref:Transcription antitermination protein NusB n=1 Tax=candidate division WOR-3 bacterium TaxID=2052148 RepID=A0A9C9EL42_UNCW3|nr:transcription antitermination factor NusB [candidate division WOR-3 bacterium]